MTISAAGLELELVTVLVTRDNSIAKRASESLRERGIEAKVQKQRIFPLFTLANIQVKKADEERANLALASLPADADLRKQPGFRKGVFVLVVVFLFIGTVVVLRTSSLPNFLRFLVLLGPLVAAQALLRRPIERLPRRRHRFAAKVGIVLGWLIFLFLAVALLGFFGAYGVAADPPSRFFH